MLFILLLIFTSLSIASVAAFLSVYGLAQLFKGTFVAVLVMGASLEIGKLVTVSFLYRYWNNINLLMKTYLISAVALLMVITSMGIFGMLSMGYQSDTIPLKDTESLVALLQKEQTELMSRKKEIDAQIASLPSNFVKGRQKLMDTFRPELQVINKRLPQISIEMRELNSKLIETEAHIGPIVYIAKAMGKTTDDATKYLILLIIVVFDPLAVALTLGINIALKLRQPQNKVDEGDVLSDVLNTQDINSTNQKSIDDDVQDDKVVNLTVDNDVTHSLMMNPDDVKSIVSDELQTYMKTLPKSDDTHSVDNPALLELARKNQIISNIRKGLT